MKYIIMECTSSSLQTAAEAGKPALCDRPLVSDAQVRELVRLYKILASDTRLKLLHALERAGELCVTDLAAEVDMTPQAVSNQLQKLLHVRIVASRRDGSWVYYHITDPCVTGLLDLGLCLLEETGKLPTPSTEAGEDQS